MSTGRTKTPPEQEILSLTNLSLKEKKKGYRRQSHKDLASQTVQTSTSSGTPQKHEECLHQVQRRKTNADISKNEPKQYSLGERSVKQGHSKWSNSVHYRGSPSMSQLLHLLGSLYDSVLISRHTAVFLMQFFPTRTESFALHFTLGDTLSHGALARKGEIHTPP